VDYWGALRSNERETFRHAVDSDFALLLIVALSAACVGLGIVFLTADVHSSR
jgi:hypothetical protein